MKLKLPNYWKKISGIILIVTILFLIISKIYNLNINKSTLVSIGKVFFTLSGLLFIMARQKIEDEYAMHTRLQAFSFSFLIGIIGYIIDESGLFTFLGYEYTNDIFRFILTEIVTYIIFFYAILYRIIKFEKQSKRNTGKE